MIEIITFIALFGLCCLVLAWFNVSRTWWSIGLILAFFAAGYAVSQLLGIATLSLVVLWLLVMAPIVALQYASLRQKLLIRPVFKLFKSQLPSISPTEQDAMDAGGVGWEGELFRGRPNWRKLTSCKVGLKLAEQAFLDGPVEELCAMVDDWQVTHEQGDLSPETWRFIKEQGFFGMIIPKAYGGLGFSAQGHAAVILKLASRSITLAVTVMLPNSLGPGQLLLKYGTERQRAHYLPRLARGEEIPCFALTAPEAGSDAAGMVDKGIVCRQPFAGREEVLGIRLNWAKRYITLSPIATLLGLAFKLYDPDGLLGEQEELGITLALIPVDTPGVETGRRHIPGAIPFYNGPTRGRDVFIPVEWIIGGAEYAGRGWRMLVECLSEGRGISLPSLSLASAKLACHTTTAYACIRRQFRTPIAKFEGVEEVLARITGRTYLMQGACHLTLAMLDAEARPSVATAIAKYHLTEMMRDTINDAMDVHGGKGIMLGPANYLMRIYQAVPISITVEGANILTRNLIIFGQGAMRCHPCLLDEIEATAIRDPEAALNAFDEALGRHVGHVLSSGSRALLGALSGGYLGGWERGRRILKRLSAALAFATEVVLALLGGKLKRRERISARLGDVLSHLYLGSGAILLFERHERLKEEKPLYDWCIDYCAWQAQEALYALIRNLPWWAGGLIRLVCFPLGRSYRPPSDRQDRALMKIVLAPGMCRNTLVDGIYIPPSENEALGTLTQAFNLAAASIPVEAKIRRGVRVQQLQSYDLESALAARVISEKEARILVQAREISRQVIQVDDFAAESFMPRGAPAAEQKEAGHPSGEKDEMHFP